MANPWGGGGRITSWAAEAELAEAEEREQAATAAAESQSFPSLKEAVSAKPRKKTMKLNEFHGTGAGGGGTSSHKGLTPDEMLRLPTGPKERSPEEMQYGRLGGGFSSYGRSGGPPPRRDYGSDGSWGDSRRQFGDFDEDTRRGPPSRALELDQPSRADEVDNWALTKKKLPSLSSASGGRVDRYGSLGGGGSRADDVDSWATGKKSIPNRSSTFGSGFRDSNVESESDRWTRGGGFHDSQNERPRLVLDPPRGEVLGSETVKASRPSPFGEARPREEVLAEKGVDWKKLNLVMEAKTSRPTSSHSSRPSSAQSSRSEGLGMQGVGAEIAIKPRPRVNPFGDAKPREIVLEEKGKDWRKIDLELEHRGIDRFETEEEKILKEEIVCLKRKIEKELRMKRNAEAAPGSGGEEPSTQELLLGKERDLEDLIHELDDKVRFGQKAVERPGSGAGRFHHERPPSRSGSTDGSRSMEFVERPRSRGMERGFLGSRDLDRSSARERW